MCLSVGVSESVCVSESMCVCVSECVCEGLRACVCLRVCIGREGGRQPRSSPFKYTTTNFTLICFIRKWEKLTWNKNVTDTVNFSFSISIPGDKISQCPHFQFSRNFLNDYFTIAQH